MRLGAQVMAQRCIGNNLLSGGRVFSTWSGGLRADLGMGSDGQTQDYRILVDCERVP